MDLRFRREFEYSQSVMNEYQELVGPILKEFPLSHVWISKLYYDGRHIDLCNDLEWKKGVIDEGLYDHFCEVWAGHNRALGSGPSLLNCSWIDDMTGPSRDLASKQRINSFLNLFRFHSDHVECYGFGSELLYKEMTQYTQKNYEAFLIACSYLKEKAGHLLEPGEDVYGYCESQKKLEPRKKPEAPIPLHLMPSHFTMEGKQITRKELVYLLLLSSGRSVKEVAYQVGASPRTAEGVLHGLRERFNCPSKFTLLQKFSKYPFLTSLPLEVLLRTVRAAA